MTVEPTGSEVLREMIWPIVSEPPGVGAGAQHHAVTDARNNAAPHGREHQVRIRQRCYKRGEQIGKEAQQHKARRGLHT